MVIIKANGIFEKRFEFINLVLPIFFLVLVILDLAFFKIVYTPKVQMWEAFIVRVLFINFAHVLLTYLMLFSLPEFRIWLKTSIKDNGNYFWVKILGVAVGLFSLLLWSKIYPNESLLSMLTFLVLVLGIQHSLFQSFGMSQFYNHQIQKTLALPVVKFKKVIRLEKLFYYLIFLSLTIRAFVGVSFKNEWDLNLTNTLIISLAVFGFAGALGIALLVPGYSQSNKALFNLRLLLYPMLLFSSVAASGIAIIHSLEYYLVFKKINEQSAQSEQNKKKVFFNAGLLILGAGIIYSFGIYFKRSPNFEGAPPVWFAVLTTTMATLQIVHYFLDRMIFRLREPANKEFIKPLIFNSRS